MCYSLQQHVFWDSTGKLHYDLYRKELTFHGRVLCCQTALMILHPSETLLPSVPGNSRSLRPISLFFRKHLGLLEFIVQMDNKAESSLADGDLLFTDSLCSAEM